MVRVSESLVTTGVAAGSGTAAGGAEGGAGLGSCFGAAATWTAAGAGAGGGSGFFSSTLGALLLPAMRMVLVWGAETMGLAWSAPEGTEERAAVSRFGLFTSL